jgi:hypothetical protein
MDSREQQMTEMFQGLKNYSQQPPASVYKGIRTKLWWSEFLSFSLTSLNVYYVGLLVAGGAAVAMYSRTDVDANTGSFSGRTMENIEVQRTAADTESQTDQLDMSEETASYTEAAAQNQTETQNTANTTSEVESSTAIFGSENRNSETQETEAAAEVEPISSTEMETTEATAEKAEVPMKRIEPNNVESFESLPFDRASYSILPNLLEQINDPKSTYITLTVIEKRDVEKEK